MRGRQIAERIWKGLNGTPFLILLLLWIGLVSALSLWLPQSPVPPADTAAFSRWVASAQPRLDPHTEWLVDWGLLSLNGSLWLRLPLAFLAVVLAVRATTLRERWDDQRQWARVRQVLLLLGLVCLLVGWGLQLQSGWSRTGVLAWPGEPIELSHAALSLSPGELAQRNQWHSPNLFLFQEELALGLEIQARDNSGDVVPLLLSSQSAAQQKLRLILNSQVPDGYFGLPEADLVFRVTLLKAPPEPEFHVQLYRSSSGALLTETVLRNGGVIFADELQLQLSSLPIPQLRAVYNPGAPVTLSGWVLVLAAGILGTPARRKRDAPDLEPLAAPESGV